jgi:hypothetical protein
MSQRVSISNISTSPEVGDAVVIYVWNPFGRSNFHGVPSRESLSYSLKLRSGKARHDDLTIEWSAFASREFVQKLASFD